MKFKCIAVSVSEVATPSGKVPAYIVTLEPVDGGSNIRMTGTGGSAASTIIYGQEIEIGLDPADEPVAPDPTSDPQP